MKPTKRIPEVLPDIFAFEGHAGLSFEQARQRLNGPYRVALAHGGELRAGKKALTLASAADRRAIRVRLCIVRYIARVTLVNVLELLDSEPLPKDART